MKYAKPLLIILFIYISSNCFGQIQNKLNSSKDTCVITTKNEYRLISKYLLSTNAYVSRLYKIDLFQLATGKINFAYEQKLSKSLSVEIGFSARPILQNDYSFLDATRHGNSILPEAFESEINADFRRYIVNKDNPLNTNKLSNYLSFTLGYYLCKWNDAKFISNRGFYDPHDNDFYSNSNVHIGNYKNTLTESKYLIKMGYGLQYRIGKVAYFDSYIKCTFASSAVSNNYYIYPELTIKAGFALSKLKNN